jgi:hypothetical protein
MEDVVILDLTAPAPTSTPTAGGCDIAKAKASKKELAVEERMAETRKRGAYWLDVKERKANTERPQLPRSRPSSSWPCRPRSTS